MLVKFKKGDVLEGEVIKITKSHIYLKFDDGWSGTIHISFLSDYYVSNINYFAKVGDAMYSLIYEIDENKKNFKLSYKDINPRYKRDPFRFHIKETKNGFNNLYNMVDKELEND